MPEGSRPRSCPAMNGLADGRLAGPARLRSCGEHGIALFFECPQRLVQQMPDLLARTCSEPREHRGVKGSERDRSEDLRPHITLRVQAEALGQSVDNRQSQVVSIDPFLLLERGSLSNKLNQSERSIVVRGGQLAKGRLHCHHGVLVGSTRHHVTSESPYP